MIEGKRTHFNYYCNKIGALKVQDSAEQRQLAAFEKFTRCMETIAGYKGYKDAVAQLMKEKPK